MKRFFYGYLNGLHQLMRRVDDTELYVIMILFLMEGSLVILIASIYHINFTLDSFIQNKWLRRLLGGLGLYLVNKYVFGFREKNYSQYDPMPKKPTLIITIGFFSAFILLLIFKDSIPMIK